MVAVGPDLFVVRPPESRMWFPLTFYSLPDGRAVPPLRGPGHATGGLRRAGPDGYAGIEDLTVVRIPQVGRSRPHPRNCSATQSVQTERS